MPGTSNYSGQYYWGILPLEALPPNPSNPSPHPFVAVRYGAFASQAEYSLAYQNGHQCGSPAIQTPRMVFWGPLVASIAADGLTHSLGNALVRRALTAGLDDTELWAHSRGVQEARAMMAGAEVDLNDGLAGLTVEAVE